MQLIIRKTGGKPAPPKNISLPILIDKRFSIDIRYNSGTIRFRCSGHRQSFSFSKPERAIRTIGHKHIRTHLLVRFYKCHVQIIPAVLFNHFSGSPIPEISFLLFTFVIYIFISFRPVEPANVGTFKTPVYKIFRLPHYRSAGTSQSVVQICRTIQIVRIAELGDRRVCQIIGDQRIVSPVGNQRLYYGSIHRKSGSVTDSSRKRNLIGHVFPRFTMIQRTDCTVAMITILIKIYIKRITDKKRCRSFRPILSRNGDRYLRWKTFGQIFGTCHTQVFLRRIGVLILNDHDQVSLFRVFHDSRINNTKIRIEKHLCL